MTQPASVVLTDTKTGVYLDSFELTSDQMPGLSSNPWSIRKRRLHGGLSDGVDRIDVSTGSLEVSICPTRGMGIWRGNLAGDLLGWNSPAQGPVHPSFIQRDELGGIGWLAGFDEWIVRCGLNNNGAPATDRLLDNTGAEQTMSLPLHGRIANIPAHHVRVELRTEPSPSINVIGLVDEANNLVQFYPDTGADATCDAGTPFTNCPWAATPEEVLGLLTDDVNCFVATAAYGSSLEPKLKTFRDFRYKVLLRYSFGRKFVSAYYKYGPIAATYIYDKPILRAIARVGLWPLYAFSASTLKFGLVKTSLIAVFLILSFLSIGRLTYRSAFGRN